jgi:Skp family chaperone for outer membrane proteins
MSLLAISTATAIAAASAAAAVGTFLAYLYFARRSEAHAVREEALALAKMRGEVITDLRGRLEALDQRLWDLKADCEQRVRELESALDKAEAEAREHAYQMQRFYAASLAALLRDLRADLEGTPPNLERPLARIRDLLDGQRPAA